MQVQFLVDWETGEKTYAPLSILAVDDNENYNSKWADATRDEMDCIKEQEVFTKR